MNAWPYVTLHDLIWPYMTLCDKLRHECMTLRDLTWPYMTLHDRMWQAPSLMHDLTWKAEALLLCYDNFHRIKLLTDAKRVRRNTQRGRSRLVSQKDGQIDGQTERQTDRQTDRQVCLSGGLPGVTGAAPGREASPLTSCSPVLWGHRSPTVPRGHREACVQRKRKYQRIEVDQRDPDYYYS